MVDRTIIPRYPRKGIMNAFTDKVYAPTRNQIRTYRLPVTDVWYTVYMFTLCCHKRSTLLRTIHTPKKAPCSITCASTGVKRVIT